MLFDYLKSSLSLLSGPTESSMQILKCETCQRNDPVIVSTEEQDCKCTTKAAERLFSMEEVMIHCEPSSCWVVVENIVYDITDFLDKHPGGFDILLEHAGRDCTGVFEDVGHSQWAEKLLSKYRIGKLRPEDWL